VEIELVDQRKMRKTGGRVYNADAFPRKLHVRDKNKQKTRKMWGQSSVYKPAPLHGDDGPVTVKGSRPISRRARPHPHSLPRYMLAAVCFSAQPYFLNILILFYFVNIFKLL
jgi:hypothetical protein